MSRYKKKNKYRLLFLISTIILVSILSFLYYKSINSKINAKEVKKSALSDNKTQKIVESVKISNITISSVGDCTLGYDDKFGYENSFPSVLRKNNSDYSYFFKNTSYIFKNDDITTANLETTFTNATIKAVKTFNFKASPDYTKILTNGGIEAVNISNNHIYDYLDQGFRDTKTSLTESNIKYFGEGDKYITEVKGVKFGFLGYNAFDSSSDFLEKLENDISNLKSQGCIVIINFHWGVESSYSPNEIQKKIAHLAVDLGADLIIGHHPHVIQGIEQYKNKIICYSLGNYCFGGNTNPVDKDTFIVQTIFSTENNKLVSYGLRVIPCSISSVSYINDYCPTPMSDTKKESFLTKLNSISTNLGFKISDEFSFITLRDN